MATINHKKYDEATETFKDFYVYDGKETLIFKVDGEGQKTEFEKPVSFAGGLEDFVSNDQPAIYRAFSTTGSYPFDRYGDLVIQARSSHDRNIVFAAGTSPAVIASMTSDGLCFGSDTAAANALDDYEEGTWTPQLQIGGLTTGITYNIQVGKYTKIGRKVSVNCYIVLTSKGTNTGTARLYGLPFTIPNDNENYSAGSFYNDGNITYTGQIQAFGNKNSTSIVLGEVTEAGSASNLTDSNLANNSAFMVSLTYFVS